MDKRQGSVTRRAAVMAVAQYLEGEQRRRVEALELAGRFAASIDELVALGTGVGAMPTPAVAFYNYVDKYAFDAAFGDGVWHRLVTGLPASWVDPQEWRLMRV